MMKIISLGWGIQSFTLSAMSALGFLPRVDAAIHADTNHERQDTYAFAARWAPWLEAHGVHVVTVKADNRGQLEIRGMIGIPARTSSDKGGQLRRMCTRNWKVRPMRQWISHEMEKRGLKKRDGAVEQWLGISLDEVQRMKPSDVKYICHRWPLIEKRMTRASCISWLQSRGLEVPPKSACVFCPYHNRPAWVDLKQKGGADWDKAVRIDESIRKARPPHDLFLHQDRIPLLEAVKTPAETGQLSMFDTGDECSGTCFV